MSELELLKGGVLPEPKLPDVFDYDASVIRLQDLRHKTGEGFRKLMEELWIARECLAVITGRPRKVKSEGAKRRSWMEYLNAIGMARSTVHKWLTDSFPDRDREISLPTKRLPPKSSTSEPVTPAKDPAAGAKNEALDKTMGKSEWGGENKEPDPDYSSQSAELPCPLPQFNGLIRERLTVLKIKIAKHPNQEKIQAAQKLLSELFILFSEG